MSVEWVGWKAGTGLSLWLAADMRTVVMLCRVYGRVGGQGGRGLTSCRPREGSSPAYEGGGLGGLGRRKQGGGRLGSPHFLKIGSCRWKCERW
jgi:hypothetical protein